MQHVLIPYQVADAAAHHRPRGILSDLYPRWIGSRELLLHGRNPYSDEVTREIQIGYYGRPLDPARPDDPKDEQRFAYPIYVCFLLAPTVNLPFPVVRITFAWALALLTAGSVLLWLRVLRWRASLSVIIILLLLTVSSIPTIQGIKLQQLSLLAAALIAVASAFLSAGMLACAGVVLAIATIKPQLVFLLVFWLMIWTLGDWKQRHKLIWSFLITMVVLIAAAQFLLPGWIPQFVGALVAYERYTGGQSLLDVLSTRTGGTLLTTFAVLGTVVACWRARRARTDSPTFKLMLALVLTVTVVIVPMMAPYNQLLLLPAIFLVLRSWPGLWRTHGLSRMVLAIAAVLVGWPYIASLGLMLASAVAPPAVVQRAWPLPLWTSIPIPLAVLAVLIPLVTRGLGDRSAAGSVPIHVSIPSP